MADIERSWLTNPSRRRALARLGGLMAASPIASAVAQIDPKPLSEHRRAFSLAEMQTAFDFEPVFFGNVPVRSTIIRPMATVRSSRSGAIARRSIGWTSCRRAPPSRHRRWTSPPSFWARK
jgi:hypothetical protein